MLITGDAVDNAKKRPVLDKFLRRIDKRIKKVAILGNWEYWGGVDLKDLEYFYNYNNCDLLVNSTHRYNFRGKSISITGLDDYVAVMRTLTLPLKRFKKAITT